MSLRYVVTYQGKEKVVAISNDWIRSVRRNLGISKREAIDLWLYDNGYIDNAAAKELTEKAKENKVDRDITPKSHAPAKRPPDLTKSKLIKQLHEFLMKSNETYGCGQHSMYAIEVTNPERVITFRIGSDIYDLTLSKRRAKS